MTKMQLVKAVSKSTGIDIKTVEYVLDSTTATIKDTLIAGDMVSLRQFGVFTRQHRKAKIGRDIKNKCAVEIPAHFVPKFKPAKEFSESVAAGRF